MSIVALANPQQVLFMRDELEILMQAYGRMVAAGEWRDYSISFGAKTASFSAFRRSADRPEFRLIKDPSLANKQGQYQLVGEAGQSLKRGHDLRTVLAPAMRRLLKAVN